MVPLGAIPALIDGLQEISRRRGLIIPCYGHAGDGNIHVNVLYDRKVDAEREAVHPTVVDIFTLTRDLSGTLSGEHGIGLTKAPYLRMELSEAAMALQQRLKRAFDPQQHHESRERSFPEPRANMKLVIRHCHCAASGYLGLMKDNDRVRNF